MKRVVPVAALLAAGVFTSAAQAHQPPVPADIAVPDGHKAYLSAHAVGVQIYSCGAGGWTLVAPRANLYDHGKLIATHFAGPTWQAKDGSAVVGKREAGVNVDPTAIDWLRLAAVSTTPGRFGQTTYIQRIHTAGGLAPAAGECTPQTAGATREVPYTADYVFFKKQKRCGRRA
jgi:uncharacterized protein DUF3455